MATRDKETEKAAEQVTMPEAVAEKAAVKEKTWIVRVTNNPEYCGVGAGGIQFANGQAVIKSERMSRWFREHKGYSVSEQ